MYNATIKGIRCIFEMGGDLLKKTIIGSICIISSTLLFCTRYICAALMAISNSVSGGFGSIENRINKFNLLLWMSILLIAIGIAILVASIYEEKS